MNTGIFSSQGFDKLTHASNQHERDYKKVAQAIEFVSSCTGEQPLLEAIESELNLDESDLQQLLHRWAKITPKQFLKTLTLKHTKVRLYDAAFALNTDDDYFDNHGVVLNAATKRYKEPDQDLYQLGYGQIDTPFGEAMIAFTRAGIARLAFTDSESTEQFLQRLTKDWPNANAKPDSSKADEFAERIFGAGANTSNTASDDSKKLVLEVSGTDFQINVWKSLLKLPSGTVTSYSQIAAAIGKPKAVRAVGTAIGANPIGLLIPCHRVVQQNGSLGGYRWGTTRKRAMLAREASASN